eukprot:CAMPEP_0204321088 /NCGR_PEP_ID=MMETSP0469-20131031/7971_1 /ASSEMBLY_ACC=CAM_ASM_000384 /TAXON_ID=2969 /ORGANISM="Oxyrrhis marina" /LENGTH=294 /DNA_ID=CAMNT_0051302357 /DNA_START=45 /DNA_END=929 /DNA_ORIENTATION=+
MSHLFPHSFDVPSVGRQRESQKPSAQSWGFGSCSRDRQQNVFISPTHEKGKPSKASPGPIYDVRSKDTGVKFGFGSAPQRLHKKALYPDSSVDLTEATVDTQRVKFRNTAGYLFGTDQKDNMRNAVILKSHPQANLGVFSPGPVAYTPDAKTIHDRSPEYSIRKKTKILASSSQTPGNVGPGSYPAMASIGMQPLSQRSTMPSFAVGKGARIPESTPDEEIINPNANISSLGKQPKSKNRTMPQYGFGTGTWEHTKKTALVQLGGDRGPSAMFEKPRLHHPSIPSEMERRKYDL